MSLLRSLLLALLAFAAAGPSCFTTMLWAGDSIVGGSGRRSSTPSYHQLSDGSVPAFADLEGAADGAPRLLLVLEAGALEFLVAGAGSEARVLEFCPGDGANDEAWMTALLRAHVADPAAWPLRVMAVGRGAERSWYLVGGEAGKTSGRRDGADLGRLLEQQGARLEPRFSPLPIDVDGLDLGDVRLARIDYRAGTSAWKDVGGKVILTPPALVLDAVLLPFEVIVVVFWFAS